MQCLDASGQLTAGHSRKPKQIHVYISPSSAIITMSISPLLLHGSLYSVCVGGSEHNVDAHTEYIDIHTQAPYL